MKNLNWGRLTDDLLEAMVTSQHELARICQVTQQSVSNWKTGTRSPGVFARNQLRELAKENSIELTEYKKVNVDVNSKSNMEINPTILEFAMKLSNLPSPEQRKIIELTELLISKS